jgi:sugar lactone lactonase YvrE
MRELRSDLLIEAQDDVGEGPIWDGPAKTLYWIDLTVGLIHRLRTDDQLVDSFDLSELIGSIGLRAAGGFVMALSDGFAITDGLGQEIRRLPCPFVPGETRMNDGACDPAGRFWAGSVANADHVGAGALYRLSSVDGRFEVKRMLEGANISNGIDWSPAGNRMYYADSPTRRIDVFDFDCAEGTMSQRRSLATVPMGMPDGLTVDAAGGVWVALWKGWAVLRYLPDGTVDAVIKLPVAQVTSVAFGGADLSELYITSARNQLSETQLVQQPLAGSLFVCRPGEQGREPNRFAG